MIQNKSRSTLEQKKTVQHSETSRGPLVLELTLTTVRYATEVNDIGTRQTAYNIFYQIRISSFFIHLA